MNQDIDVAIDPDVSTIALFVGQFDPDTFYVDDAISATERRGMFHVIDVTTGWNVDLIIRKDRAFSEEEFGRRVPVMIADVATHVASAQDTIPSKLEWPEKSGSERQLRDVLSVIRVQRATLDFDYLQHWATELGVADLLQTALDDSA